MKTFADQFAKHRRLKPKLKIARNLLERVPDVFIRLEKFGMRGVLEFEKFGGGEHFVRR